MVQGVQLGSSGAASTPGTPGHKAGAASSELYSVAPNYENCFLMKNLGFNLQRRGYYFFPAHIKNHRVGIFLIHWLLSVNSVKNYSP